MNYSSLSFPSFVISYFKGLKEKSHIPREVESWKTKRSLKQFCLEQFADFNFSKHLSQYNVTLDIREIRYS